ncbi:hypothetical protein HMPREF2837_10615 [Streptococcus sp. HMSC071D03]|uniref:hypothetical protein n=1 Tax=Streptococcus sp. HMSC071D03 TaxID=1739341 RepID=UPI0008B9FB88|nr:hypothetical protein [Streptococcus sp. HMSC071D03]OFK01600.1 hypothetical protein HMPREF2837_10615 [Streptococcus sp. HMSC071D03]
MKIKIVDQILSQKCFWTVIFSCWIFIGIILSIFDSSLKNNYVYVLGVNSLLLAQIITYRNLMKKERNVSTSISGTKVNGLPLFSILSKNSDYLNKWYSITVSFTIGVTYFVSLILLKVLIWNELITIYGAITLILTVFIAIQLYLKYLLYILTLRKISKLEFTTLTPVSLHNPSESDWVVKFTDNMNSFSNHFGILGIAYTSLFYLTTPLSAIRFSENILIIDTPNNLAFAITWGIIFILIGFGYVILDYIWKKYIEDIIKKIKRMQLTEYDTTTNNRQINKDYIELFKLYKDSPNFPHLFNRKTLNPIGFIPILINLYRLLQPFLTQN